MLKKLCLQCHLFSEPDTLAKSDWDQAINRMVSMPAYDPNSFSDGISHLEWKMLSDNDHVPLMNKVTQGLYPPGSTVKPMNGLALLAAGVGAHDRVVRGERAERHVRTGLGVGTRDGGAGGELRADDHRLLAGQVEVVRLRGHASFL